MHAASIAHAQGADILPFLFWPSHKSDRFLLQLGNLLWISFFGFCGLWTGKRTLTNRLMDSLPFLSPFGGLPSTPRSMEKMWGFFKWCQKCGSKFPPLDIHSLCLFCLGEVQRVDTCLHCTCFLMQARKNQAVWLQVALTTAALTAPMSSSTLSQDLVITAATSTLKQPQDSGVKKCSLSGLAFASPYLGKKQKSDGRERKNEMA